MIKTESQLSIPIFIEETDMTDKTRQTRTTAAGAVELEESKLDAVSAGDLSIYLKIPPPDDASGRTYMPITIPKRIDKSTP